MLSRFLLLKSKALRFISLPKNGWFATFMLRQYWLMTVTFPYCFNFYPPNYPK